jgi:uncharacterized lipoprotein NlpE involved in copper resistance
MRKVTVISAIASVFLLVSCKNTSNTETLESEVSITDISNSQNSLDWVGIYQGVLPCADCEGIETTIELREDLTFTLTSLYLGKNSEESMIENGKFEWDETGNKIILSIENGERQYKVEENKIVHLNNEGNKIEGELAEKYILSKI